MKCFINLLTIIFLFPGFCNTHAQDVLPVSEFKAMWNAHPEWQLVDARTPDEFAKDHLKGALNVDFNGAGFKTQVDALEKTTPVLIYCLSGGRSAKAAAYMRKKGMTVYEMKGGMIQWKANGLHYESNKPVSNGMSLQEYESQTAGPLVLVDFYATWCAPCRKMGPELTALFAENTGKFSLLQMNVEENETVVRALKIEGVPVLMLYKNGKVVWKANQYVTKAELQNVLAAHF